MKGNVPMIELEIPATVGLEGTEPTEVLAPAAEATEPCVDPAVAPGPTDEHGNSLPVQTTDLREAEEWVLEGPSARRFLGRDVPMAIVAAYRRIPPEVRGRRVSGSTSHLALGALAAGAGWKKGFWPYALPTSLKSALNIATPELGEGGWEGAGDWSLSR